MKANMANMDTVECAACDKPYKERIRK